MNSHTLTMEQGPNLRSQDMRYRRIGGEQAYRDEPMVGCMPYWPGTIHSSVCLTPDFGPDFLEFPLSFTILYTWWIWTCRR